MSSDSRLLIMEKVGTPVLTQHNHGAIVANGHANGHANGPQLHRSPPYPLLGEWGVVDRYAQLQCMVLMVAMNGVDR